MVSINYTVGVDFRVTQEKFEGPLELLLDLIEREKLSISEVSLTKVTDDYIRYVKSLEKIDLEELARFLVIAATLVLIKSRSLLPSLKFSEEEEQSIEELAGRLAEYKRIQELALELKKLEARGAVIHTREQYFGREPVFYPPRKLNAAALRETFRAILASLPNLEKLAEEKIRRIISLEEKITHIRAMLQATVEHSFAELVKGAKEKVEVIVSFLAVLELARQKFVELEQKQLFENIVIKKSRQPLD